MKVSAELRVALNEAAWAVARRLVRFGYAEISAEMSVTMEVATKIVRAWEAEGACTVIQKGVGLRKMFQVVPDFVRKPEPEGLGSVPLNLWTSMRGLKSFTPKDLAAHSNVGSVQVSTEAAAGYCQTLLRAGYLKVVRTAIPGSREAIYRLIRDTGPRPPRERRVKAVFDDNLGTLVHVTGGMR